VDPDILDRLRDRTGCLVSFGLPSVNDPERVVSVSAHERAVTDDFETPYTTGMEVCRGLGLAGMMPIVARLAGELKARRVAVGEVA
jgi:hypothetical protein